MKEYKERVKNLRRKEGSLRNLGGDGENGKRSEVEERNEERVV